MELYEDSLMSSVQALKQQVRGYGGMCSNIASQLKDKTGFIRDKCAFMEQCESEMSKMLSDLDD